MNYETLSIKILDPKVKGLLQELQKLSLIEIDSSEIEKKKQMLAEKLEGINLKDLDTKSLQDIIDKR